jgi:hypothetical protein
MAKYAAKTTVTVEKSRNEIEHTLARYGAESFMYGWDGGRAVIAFVVTIEGEQKRQVRFELPLPSRDEHRFQFHSRGRRTATQAEALWEQACRQRWRALALVVKAKLEAVESGIASFEAEFLAYIVLPDGSTVGGWVTPQLEAAYEDKIMPTAIPGLRPALGRGEDEE